MHKYDTAVAVSLASGNDEQTYEELSAALGISASTVHGSVGRLRDADLLLPGPGKRANRLALLEFLEHGARYVFPARPGPVRLGVPTAHSAPMLAAFIAGEADPYVWPSKHGTVRGSSIDPLLPNIDDLAERSPAVYAALTLIDALRVGRARERELASRELRRLFGTSTALGM